MKLFHNDIDDLAETFAVDDATAPTHYPEVVIRLLYMAATLFTTAAYLFIIENAKRVSREARGTSFVQNNDRWHVPPHLIILLYVMAGVIFCILGRSFYEWLKLLSPRPLAGENANAENTTTPDEEMRVERRNPLVIFCILGRSFYEWLKLLSPRPLAERDANAENNTPTDEEMGVEMRNPLQPIEQKDWASLRGRQAGLWPHDRLPSGENSTDSIENTVNGYRQNNSSFLQRVSAKEVFEGEKVIAIVMIVLMALYVFKKFFAERVLACVETCSAGCHSKLFRGNEFLDVENPEQVQSNEQLSPMQLEDFIRPTAAVVSSAPSAFVQTDALTKSSLIQQGISDKETMTLLVFLVGFLTLIVMIAKYFDLARRLTNWNRLFTSVFDVYMDTFPEPQMSEAEFERIRSTVSDEFNAEIQLSMQSLEAAGAQATTTSN